MICIEEKDMAQESCIQSIQVENSGTTKATHRLTLFKLQFEQLALLTFQDPEGL